MNDLARQQDDLGPRGRHASPDERAPHIAALPRYEPATAEALAAIVRNAYEARRAVLPEGLGTRGPLGARPARADAIVSTRALDGVVHYEPGDLTISVEAGMPLATLDELLHLHGQRLAARPFALTGSVGGLVISGAEGALASSQGGIRDVMLGARTCHGDGLLARSRGRVVKNVAGYDVPRLLVGSLGSLGVLVEASLRLSPVPEHTALCVVRFADATHAFAAARRVLDGPLEPALVDILAADDGRASECDLGHPARAGLRPEVAPRLLVLLEGRAARVDGQLERLQALLRELGGETPDVLRDDEALPLLRRLDDPLAGLREVAPDAGADAHRLVVRLQRRPRTLCADLQALLAQAREAGLSAAWLARPGLGSAVIDLRPSGDAHDGHDAHAAHAHARPHATWTSSAATLLDAPRRAPGLTLLAAPDVLRDALRVFGPPPSALALMRAVKLALDPRDVLAPGRCAGGL